MNILNKQTLITGGEMGKLFLTTVAHLISGEGIRELENHHKI